MDSKLKALFAITEAPTPMQQQDMVVGDAPSGAMLRRRYVHNRREAGIAASGLRTQDLRDVAMTFCLVFVGAMMFLID